MSMETLSTNTAHGGVQGVYKHHSTATGTDTTYASGGAQVEIKGTAIPISISGTADDDTLHYSGRETKIDGGGGTDTLELNANVGSLATSDYNKLTNIETIDLKTGDHALNDLSEAAVKGITGKNDGQLTITGGDTKDSVELEGGWSTTGTATEHAPYTSGNAEVTISDSTKISISGTAGDDTLHYSGRETLIDGGKGTDTLQLNADVVGLGTVKLDNIERIDLRNGDHKLTLNVQDVLDISHAKELMILGDDKDTVKLADKADWIAGSPSQQIIDGFDLNVFDTAVQDRAKLLIETKIQHD